jgi:hypothetical protein
VRSARGDAQSVDDVEALSDQIETHGWGGGFSFRRSGGNVWDVAWERGATFDERGGLTFA